MSNWNDDEKINKLITKMTGTANEILQNILDSYTQDYEETKAVLLQRFLGNKTSDFFQTKFEGIDRRPGEFILDYAFCLKILFEKGYLKSKNETTDDTNRL